jgi:hypothetical protein
MTDPRKKKSSDMSGPAPGTQAQVNLGDRHKQPQGPDATPRLPHERDQSSDMTDPDTDPVIEQAYSDVKRGLEDTDKGPVADKAYRKLKERD